MLASALWVRQSRAWLLISFAACGDLSRACSNFVMVGKEYRGKLPVGLDVWWLTCSEVNRQAHWNAHAIAAV